MLDCAERKEGKGWEAFGGEITVVGPEKLHLFGRGLHGVSQKGSHRISQDISNKRVDTGAKSRMLALMTL